MSAKLESRLPEIADKLPNRGELIALAVADFIADRAKLFAPVSETTEAGRLRDSIEARPYTTGIGQGIVREAAVVAVFYWFFNEFGTKNQAPHPFMIPAVEVARAAVNELSAKYLDAL